MEDGIVIFNRSDMDPDTPKIIVRARTDTKISPVIETIKNNLLQRKTHFSVKLNPTEAKCYTANNEELPFYLINRACSFRKPFVNNDFDYLRRSVRRVYCQMSISPMLYTISYEIQYLTTLYQEEELDRRLRTLFKDNNIYQCRNPISRISFIYDFIARNVKYDHTYTKYSAYDALMNCTSVCEGCATLLYRMLSMAGVPCRIITGTGRQERHAWNIIRIDNKWFNADVTWDLTDAKKPRPLSSYSFFLRSNSTFANHTRDPEFSSQQFFIQHPMSVKDYSV